METNVNYTIVGAFVIVLTTAIVLAVIWLSSGFSFEQYTNYMVYMQESVSGLNVDSAVEYNGVTVGTVKNIQLNPNNPRLVELILSIQKGTPITQSTVATLATRGVTGLVYLALKDNGADPTPLVASKGQRYPVIRTAPSFFVQLDTALTQLSKNLRQVSESIQSVLDPQNQILIKQSLINLQQITGTLAANSQKLTDILANTAHASAQLTPLIQSSAGALRLLQYQTLPAAYHLLNNLDNVANTLSQVTIQMQQNPAVLVRGSARQTLGPGETK